MHFDSREDMIIFICKNQAGRRNLTPEQLSYLRGKEYEAEKKKVTNEQGANQHGEDAGKKYPQPKRAHVTAEKLGKEHGVAEKTIRNDAKYAKAVDTIGGAAPQLRQKILSGEIGAPKKQIVEIAEKPERERRPCKKPCILRAF